MKKLFAIFVESEIKSEAINDKYDTDATCLKLYKNSFNNEDEAVQIAEEDGLELFYIISYYTK